jgi:hypothetical protein
VPRYFWVVVALIVVLFAAKLWNEQPDDAVAHSQLSEQTSSSNQVAILDNNQSQTMAGDETDSVVRIDPIDLDQTSQSTDDGRPASSHKNAEILDTLHQRSRTELAALAIGVADYFEAELLGFDDLYRFTDRLLRIEQNNKDDLLHSEPAIYGEISFANSDRFAMGELWQTTEFNSADSRIVAHMPEIDAAAGATKHW